MHKTAFQLNKPGGLSQLGIGSGFCRVKRPGGALLLPATPLPPPGWPHPSINSSVVPTNTPEQRNKVSC